MKRGRAEITTSQSPEHVDQSDSRRRSRTISVHALSSALLFLRISELSIAATSVAFTDAVGQALLRVVINGVLSAVCRWPSARRFVAQPQRPRPDGSLLVLDLAWPTAVLEVLAPTKRVVISAGDTDTLIANGRLKCLASIGQGCSDGPLPTEDDWSTADATERDLRGVETILDLWSVLDRRGLMVAPMGPVGPVDAPGPDRLLYKRVSSFSLGGHDKMAVTVTHDLVQLPDKDMGSKRPTLWPWGFKLPVQDVCVGGEFALILTMNSCGEVWSVGDGHYGELGLGSCLSARRPRLITGLLGVSVKNISAGQHHSAAVGDGGQLYTWGKNEERQLGRCGGRMHWNAEDGVWLRFDHKPKMVELEAAVVHVSAGYFHTLAIASTGGAFGFGSNCEGQLGLETLEHCPPSRISPRPPKDIVIVDVSAGAHSSLVLVAGGGANRVYVTGDPDRAEEAWLEVPLPDGENPVSVRAGLTHWAVGCDTRRVYAWGDNSHGQLGHGSASRLPVQVTRATHLVEQQPSRSEELADRRASPPPPEVG